MYLQLKQVIYYFEKILTPSNNYFNIFNYQFFSKEERQDLINTDIYRLDDFLPVPQLDRDDIVIAFLDKHNEKKMIREALNGNLFHKFHWYVEDNKLVDDWELFEKEELLRFAMGWCEQNHINYTCK